ncbi:MAG: M56 family metallopeptidase [Methylacidiphilales bacterium]|nr:M56 family metallopeptidase [Candidatus Methylacidiphilales bacterium]
MHLVMMVVAVVCSYYIRTKYSASGGSWSERWQRAIALFLFPPLLLLTTSVAVVCMESQGHMIGLWDGWFAYGLAKLAVGEAAAKELGIALGFCCWVMVKLLISTLDANYLLKKINDYPQIDLEGFSAHLLNISDIFIAQVGFYHPKLVVSEGLLQLLDREHLEAVLLHEQAHYHYQDTFWFFWLGWIRDCTAWLPNTNVLYSELLALRELRADRWAINHVDSLILAESLLTVVTKPILVSPIACGAFNSTSQNLFVERIEALLKEPEDLLAPNWWLWIWLILAFSPLATIPLHHHLQA